jgi:hypothetical protein
MIDYYLKFSTKEEAFSALKDAGYPRVNDEGFGVFIPAGYTSQDEEGNEFIVSATHDFCIDEVGIIYKGGKWEPNENGEIITIEEPVQLDGWHINIRILSGDIAETLRPYVISNPVTPYRIFG